MDTVLAEPQTETLPEPAKPFPVPPVEAGRSGGHASGIVRKALSLSPYEVQQLARARGQLASLNRRLDAALKNPKVDPKAIESLCRAISVLSERERVLAGRPLPGSHRPTAPRGRGSAASVEPV